MKVEYDSDTDTLTVTLRRGVVAESDEDEPGLILDYDEAGDLLSIEVLDATGRIPTLPLTRIERARRRGSRTR
jgi:uncharacterized protein YuzE